jgi:hypothetical protein
VRVEAVQSVQQPDRRHMFQVRQWLAAAAVAAGDVLHDRQVPHDQFRAGLLPSRIVRQQGGELVRGRTGTGDGGPVGVVVRGRFSDLPIQGE